MWGKFKTFWLDIWTALVAEINRPDYVELEREFLRLREEIDNREKRITSLIIEKEKLLQSLREMSSATEEA